ncbi:MAG: hypothetical protein AB7G06_09845 [Bdellovibrionales bacterium]
MSVVQFSDAHKKAPEQPTYIDDLGTVALTLATSANLNADSITELMNAMPRTIEILKSLGPNRVQNYNEVMAAAGRVHDNFYRNASRLGATVTVLHPKTAAAPKRVGGLDFDVWGFD